MSFSFFIFVDGVVSIASGRIADSNVFDPNEKMFYHWIDFLFVHKDFQVIMIYI